MWPFKPQAMKDSTDSFGNLYHPVKALLILQKTGDGDRPDFYIESYDMDLQGCPVNGHPLSVRESHALARALQVHENKPQGFLSTKGLMPANVLSVNSSPNGFAVWHTKPSVVKLLFTESLGITSGDAPIPALVWKAGKDSLQVFAVRGETLAESTPLCHAPFFNIYPDGKVCMGNVKLRIPKGCGLEGFMDLWQGYFFNSYFSHLFQGHQPVKGNIVQLWQQLTATQKPFPSEVLLTNGLELKHLIQ